MQLSFILEFFTQHCQQGWLLPCSRFSVSQNFCSSLKYLSRMYTFDVPIPAILTTGAHHFSPPGPISPYLGLPPKSGASQSPESVFPPGPFSHILETVLPAGRPSTGCSPMGTSHRAGPNSQVGGAAHHHLAARDPAAAPGWRQPLNPTCPLVKPAQHGNRFPLS